MPKKGRGLGLTDPRSDAQRSGGQGRAQRFKGNLDGAHLDEEMDVNALIRAERYIYMVRGR